MKEPPAEPVTPRTANLRFIRREYTTAGKELQMELSDVMHTVATASDPKNDQRVSITRNGNEYTVLLVRSSGMDYDYARKDCDYETALKLYTKIAKAFITGRYTWETRKRWVA